VEVKIKQREESLNNNPTLDDEDIREFFDELKIMNYVYKVVNAVSSHSNLQQYNKLLKSIDMAERIKGLTELYEEM
jgi:glutaredoxin-related protein